MTAIDPVSAALGLKLFPNPARSRLYITTDLPVPASSLLLELYDVQGKKVYTTTLKGNRVLNQTLFLDPYLKGLYILKLTGTNINSTSKVFVY
ncbi:MAG: T9SS type A sorting domain-containing protein [Sphingobacteriales bacterium]|nr:MAG: T9SS type A sorting domain-containing protein [Sphingobacteriales bacterium]